MRLRTIITVWMMAATVIALQAKDYNYQTVGGDALKARIYTLDNGMKVFLSVNKEKPRIQTYIAVRTGSRNDPAETTGLAHYLEHLMFKGTKQFGTSDYAKEKPLLDAIERKYEHYRTLSDTVMRRQCYHEIDSISQLAAAYFIPNEYDKLMASVGSQGSNAYTSSDVTCYTENIPANEVENWLRIQSDRFMNMVIRGFHTELEAVYEEKNISLGKDEWKAYDAMNALLYPTHPYGTQTTLGTQEHLKNPSIVNIMNYYRHYYVPDNVAVCMAGDFDPDRVVELIDRYFGTWRKSGNVTRPEYPKMPDMTADVDTTILGQEAESVILGWRFNGQADMQADTVNVIAKMLANGKAGLMEVDLEQKMLVRSVSVFTDEMTDYSALLMHGFPKEGQTPEQLRALIVNELGKLRSGDFSDDLLPSVINNMKLNFYKALRNNDDRAGMFVSAFVSGRPWADEVAKLDRMSKMTKSQIVAFANKYLNDNYACVYKKVGVDTSVKKIEKPQITAIPTNRDMSSDFLNSVVGTETTPIQPRFLDFKKDLKVTKTTKNIPLLYKQNTEDGLFDLCFDYDFGTEDVKGMDLVPEYLYYIGTDKMSPVQMKQEFYKLACNYYIYVTGNKVGVYLSGLSENMPKALALLEDLLHNAKGDDDSYGEFVSLQLKEREDMKANQESNFGYLNSYCLYGPYNPMRNVMGEKELREAGPQTLTGLLKRLSGYAHTIMYYGPYAEKQLDALMAKTHKTARNLAKVPVGREYVMEQTPANEVVIAPYDAKNIYMMQFHNEGKAWNPDDAAVENLFNEYFGSGMNTVVFQELREARGLAYSAYAEYNEPQRKNHPESFFTYIISQNDKMADCINVFNSILDTVPQAQGAFDIAKQGVLKKLQSERITRFGVLRAYMNAKEKGIDYDIREKIYSAVPSLGMADIVRFERQNMAKKPFRYIILGDEKNLDMKALERIAPVRRLSTDEIFGF